MKYATFNKPSLGLLHSWIFPSDRPSKISANMSCPGASSGFKIWTNWHQDSSALIKPSCLIYLSDQTRLQNATVALSFTGENGNLHVFLTWVIGVSLSEDEWQKSQSLAASLVLWSFHWLFYQCNWSTALSVMDNFNVSVFQYICRHLSKQKKQKTHFQDPRTCINSLEWNIWVCRSESKYIHIIRCFTYDIRALLLGFYVSNEKQNKAVISFL